MCNVTEIATSLDPKKEHFIKDCVEACLSDKNVTEQLEINIEKKSWIYGYDIMNEALTS